MNHRTTFILGAGASAPYGFDLGSQLKWNIIALADQLGGEAARNHLVRRAAERLAGREYPTDDRFRRIHDSLPAWSSVDAFLEEFSDLEPLGRLLIAFVIGAQENPSSLLPRGRRDDWYYVLMSQLIQNRSTLEPGQFRFVTFNYDRSLEHALLHYASRSSPDGGQAMLEMVRSFPIVHMYGSLGLHPGYLPSATMRDHSRPYRPIKEIDEPSLNADPETVARHLQGYEKRRGEMISDLLTAASNISLMQRGEVNDEAAKLIADANTVVFMGFGFDATNVERLGFKRGEDRPPGQAVFYTNYSNPERFLSDHVLPYIGNKGKNDRRSAKDCAEMLTNVLGARPFLRLS